MNAFVLHPEAYNDLDSIWEYIATDSIDATDRVREEFYEAISALAVFPDQGHRRIDLTSRSLRFQTVRDYLIAYSPDEKPLLVIAIIHGRRSPRTIAAMLRDRG